MKNKITFSFFLFLVKVVTYYALEYDFSNIKNRFVEKSIYFSSLNNEDNFYIDDYRMQLEFEKPHKSDTVIAKLEIDNRKSKLIKSTHLNVLLTSSFYKVNVCSIDKIQSLKHKFKNFLNIPFKGQNCYFRQDYLNTKLTRTNENINLDLLNQNLENNEKGKINSDLLFDLQSIIDINLNSYNSFIKEFFSDFMMWNEHSYYELIFFYDESKNIFVLDKIFIYFSIPSNKESTKVDKYYFISLIKNGSKVFDNIFIHYKVPSKILKFTKNYKATGQSKVSFSDFNDKTLNYVKTIETKRNESIFHNLLTIKFRETVFKYIVNNLEKVQLSEICFFVYQPLTEDVYVEKNELSNYLNSIHKKNEISYRSSEFIDQELSSDLGEQYFTSFIICDKFEAFKHDNEYSISYPLHFRYAPTIPSESNADKIDAVMPHPHLEILTKNNTVNVPDINIILQNKIFNTNIIDKDTYFIKIKRDKSEYHQINEFYNERQLFFDEVKLKLKYVTNDYNFYTSNEEKFIHQIPAGKQKHFYIVLVITILITILGFLFIFYGIIVYLFSSTDSKREIETELDKKNN